MSTTNTGPILLSAGALLLACVSLVVVMIPDVERPAPPAPAQDEEASAAAAREIIALRERVQQLELQVNELESRTIREDPAAAIGESFAGADAASELTALDDEALLLAALREGSAELDELVAAAAARAQKRAGGKGKGGGGKSGSEEEVIAWIGKEIDRVAEEHALIPAQVESLSELTRRAIAERREAELAGAGEWELTQLDVGVQAEARQIMGDPVYFAEERRRLTQELRGWVTWLPSAVGGLSDEQHAQLDQLISSSVESRVHDVVRLRSEPMPETDHGRLREHLQEQTGLTWETIRDQVLTDTQRARIPGK